MTLRKVKSLAEILKEFPDGRFTHEGFALSNGKLLKYVYFEGAGREIDFADDLWEEFLHPLPKKKEIKLYIAKIKMGQNDFHEIITTQKVVRDGMESCWKTSGFGDVSVEEKTIEVDDND